MQGINMVSFSGNVGNITYTKTDVKNDLVAVFMVCSEERENNVTWAKVSAYGRLAEYCQNRLTKGCFVEIAGKLSNRINSSNDHLELEIKAVYKINIINLERRNDGS